MKEKNIKKVRETNGFIVEYIRKYEKTCEILKETKNTESPKFTFILFFFKLL